MRRRRLVRAWRRADRRHRRRRLRGHRDRRPRHAGPHLHLQGPRELADDADQRSDATTSISARRDLQRVRSSGASIARLGDFNGDGVDDFAIGAPSFGGYATGRVVDHPGQARASPASRCPTRRTRSSSTATRRCVNPQFGYRVLRPRPLLLDDLGDDADRLGARQLGAASGNEGRHLRLPRPGGHGGRRSPPPITPWSDRRGAIVSASRSATSARSSARCPRSASATRSSASRTPNGNAYVFSGTLARRGRSPRRSSSTKSAARRPVRPGHHRRRCLRPRSVVLADRRFDARPRDCRRVTAARSPSSTATR